MGQNTQIVRDFIAAWGKNDIDQIMSFFDPVCVYHNMPVEPVTGLEAIRAVIEGFAGAATRIEWVVHHIAEDEAGVVLTERTDRFEIGGKWVELRVMGTFVLRAGKISEWRDYFEMKQFTDQLPAA
jgi:limonene-1,2-epoxide hydrolase